MVSAAHSTACLPYGSMLSRLESVTATTDSVPTKRVSKARRPDMASELLKVFSACAKAHELLGPALSPDMAVTVSHVATSIGARPAPDGQTDVYQVEKHNGDAVSTALVALATELVVDPPRGSRRHANKVAKMLVSGEFKQELSDARVSCELGGSLSDVKDFIRLQGFDAELLCDGVTRFEAGRHTGLVWHQVNRAVGSYPGYVPDELFGYGWRGLVVALNNYDPQRVAFSTYACTRIRGTIADGVRAESPIPKRLNTWYRKVNATVEDLTYALGRPPSQDEIAAAVAAERLAKELGRPATLSELADGLEQERKQMFILPRLGVPASLDEATPGVVWADPADDAVTEALREDVRVALEELPPDERSVVVFLELEGRSIEEVSNRLGISTRQVRTVRARAHATLSEKLSAWRTPVT